ncbi:TPA: DUF1738 domain-containing protein [Stenotrophomonas maltophilia]|nr:ArdC family protein [Stenotrophomonas geniculata]HDS1545140.1 DUF1738 domain-containing protein [Stenotrophomonas maltophilia]
MSDATPNESFLQRHSRDVVERLIRQMEQGTGPFLKPWDAGVDLGLPMNPITGKSYRGGNLLHLWARRDGGERRRNGQSDLRGATAISIRVLSSMREPIVHPNGWARTIPHSTGG